MTIFSYKSDSSIILSDIMSNYDESEYKIKVVKKWILKSPGPIIKAIYLGILSATCLFAWWGISIIICDDPETLSSNDGIRCIPWWFWISIVGCELFIGFLCMIGYKQEIKSHDKILLLNECNCCWIQRKEIDNIV